MKSNHGFQYKILSKRHLNNPEDLRDFQEAYQFWTMIWKDIFTKVGSPEAFIVDDFYRQDYIPVVKHEGRIVAAHFYTVFDTRNPSVPALRYFSIFNDEAKQWISSRRPKNIMSMEFLSVHPEFRKKWTGFSIAEALIQLGFLFMRELQVDMALGVAVKVAGVDKMATNLSAAIIGNDVKRGNLVCNLLGLTVDQISRHPDEAMNTAIMTLWNERTYAGDIPDAGRKVA